MNMAVRPTVTIIPPHHGTPRFGNRTAMEHDAADAFHVRQKFAVDNHLWLHEQKEEAVRKAMDKKKKEEEAKAKGLIFFIPVLLVISPIITGMEYWVLHRLGLL